MTQKNSENIYKALKEEERTLLEKNVTWMEKAFKRKEGYVTFGNAGGELVFCEGEFLSYLEGFQTIILKDGKQIAAYNWKIEDGIKNFQVLCSMKTDKSGKIFFCLIIRGDAPIIVGHTEEIEQESQYNLLIHAWDTETGYIWVGDNRDDGLTRIDYLISGNATGKQNFIEKLTAQSYLQKNSEEVKKHEYGRQSGVTVSCDKTCRVLSGVNWELQLNATHDSIVFVDEGSTFVSSLDFARAIQHSDNYYVLVTREDLSTLPYSVNAILELKKTTSRFKRTYNKAYPIYDSLTASNVQLEGVEKLLTEDANSGYQLFTKIGEKYGIVCISAAGKDNIKQRIFPMKSEKVLVIADGAAFGPQMNDIYAYDPDTEEEAGQCVDEVIQIAEESGAEIQFY